jgi:cytochrome c oxidase assembly factor CtaG
MVHDFRYYFQHPYLRIFIAYFVTFCNFLIYAEDPVAHSIKECSIPVVGNMFAFVCTRYPSNGWSALKVVIWLLGMITGVFFGKFVMHKLVFSK